MDCQINYQTSFNNQINVDYQTTLDCLTDIFEMLCDSAQFYNKIDTEAINIECALGAVMNWHYFDYYQPSNSRTEFLTGSTNHFRRHSDSITLSSCVNYNRRIASQCLQMRPEDLNKDELRLFVQTITEFQKYMFYDLQQQICQNKS